MTYMAIWTDDNKIIFRGRRKEQVRDNLPKGTRVLVDEDSTLGRVDDGDEYEHALFISGSRKIVVMSDSELVC